MKSNDFLSAQVTSTEKNMLHFCRTSGPSRYTGYNSKWVTDLAQTFIIIRRITGPKLKMTLDVINKAVIALCVFVAHSLGLSLYNVSVEINVS